MKNSQQRAEEIGKKMTAGCKAYFAMMFAVIILGFVVLFIYIALA